MTHRSSHTPLFDPPVSRGSIAAVSPYTSVTVTIEQGASQLDPASLSPIVFDVVFSEPVTGFATGDVTLSGTAGATTATVSGSGATYTVSVTGMTTAGTVTATIAGGVAVSASGALNMPSTSTDNTVTWSVGPIATINQGASQLDPVAYGPIVFDIVWSQAVSGFATGDVNFTASTTGGSLSQTVVNSGDNIHFTVSVEGMLAAGDVIATINASVCTGTVGGLANVASTSTDNVVAYACTDTDTPFADDFNRPDTNPSASGVTNAAALGACWAQTQLGGTFLWRISSNRMTYSGSPSSSVSSRWAEPLHSVAGPDLTVEWDAVQMPGTFLSYQCQIRATADLTIGVGTSSYLLDISHSGFGSPNLVLGISSIVAGVSTTLTSVTLNNQGSGGASPLMPIRFRFSAIGTAIKLDTLPVGGGAVTNRLSVVNGAVTTGSHVAFRALSSSNSNTIILDNLSIS